MKAKVFTDKYDVVGIEPGIHNVADFGRVDLTNLSLEEADALFRSGFPFLAKKGKKAPAVDEVQS